MDDFFHGQLKAVKGQLLGEENRASVILRQLLDGSIRVIPFMRIDGKRVVPRLEFTINLVAALPPTVAAPLRQAAGDEAATEPVAMLNRTLLVNVFDEPQLVKHARVILGRRLEGKTYKETAKELDLTECNMETCVAITRLMDAAGLPEPYRRLTEKPNHVPQQALAAGGRTQRRRQEPPSVMTSGIRGRRRRLRLRSPDFMAGGGLPIPGVLDDGREIVSKLFRNSSPSRVNVFDRRVAIRRFLCHRSATPPACR